MGFMYHYGHTVIWAVALVLLCLLILLCRKFNGFVGFGAYIQGFGVFCVAWAMHIQDYGLGGALALVLSAIGMLIFIIGWFLFRSGLRKLPSRNST